MLRVKYRPSREIASQLINKLAAIDLSTESGLEQGYEEIKAALHEVSKQEIHKKYLESGDNFFDITDDYYDGYEAGKNDSCGFI